MNLEYSMIGDGQRNKNNTNNDKKKRNAKGIKIGQVNQIEKKQCRDMKLSPIQVSTWVNGYFPGVGYFKKFKAITICVEKECHNHSAGRGSRVSKANYFYFYSRG